MGWDGDGYGDGLKLEWWRRMYELLLTLMLDNLPRISRGRHVRFLSCTRSKLMDFFCLYLFSTPISPSLFLPPFLYVCNSSPSRRLSRPIPDPVFYSIYSCYPCISITLALCCLLCTFQLSAMLGEEARPRPALLRFSLTSTRLLFFFVQYL